MNLYRGLFSFAMLTVFIVSCKNSAKKEDKIKEETVHNWSEINIAEFQKNCTGFLEIEGVENPAKYCDCLLDSSIEAYPDAKKAIELEQHEIVSLFEDSKCIDDILLIKIEDPWTQEVEALFMENCKQQQKTLDVEMETAESYCVCALEKVKQIIPNPQHVIALTEEELDHVLESCN